MTPTCGSCREHSRISKGMRHIQEFENGNTFECRTCGSIGFYTKDKTGGTLGAGARSDGVRSATGRGWGNGTHTYRGIVR